jgi:hypothetical protein
MEKRSGAHHGAQSAMCKGSAPPERGPHVYLDDISAARYLGFNNGARRLKDLRGRGGGPKWLRIGSAVRYRLDWLDAWANEQAVVSTSEETGRHREGRRP